MTIARPRVNMAQAHAGSPGPRALGDERGGERSVQRGRSRCRVGLTAAGWNPTRIIPGRPVQSEAPRSGPARGRAQRCATKARARS